MKISTEHKCVLNTVVLEENANNENQVKKKDYNYTSFYLSTFFA